MRQMVLSGYNQNERGIILSNRFIERIFIIDYFYKMGRISLDRKLELNLREAEKEYGRQKMADK